MKRNLTESQSLGTKRFKATPASHLGGLPSPLVPAMSHQTLNLNQNQSRIGGLNSNPFGKNIENLNPNAKVENRRDTKIFGKIE
jgi:hypothetical protein